MSENSPATASPSPPAGEHGALPPGTRFGELEVLRVVGVGGFGIVYLARDHSLDRDVALKEYMPGQLASRGPDAQVSVRSGADQDTFALGLRSFVNEARLLAKFDHRSLLKVYRFWEANNTAYMVMPFLEGRTLRETRNAMQSPPDERWFRQTLNPLLEALELLHGEMVYHRDIAPDNIFLPADGAQAVLLDFGAARRAIGDSTQAFTAILKPSYAPIEQYAESVSLRQGPWTDVYAMGAVMHYLIKGVPPPPATARMFEDHSDVLADFSFPGLSQVFLSAIDWALAVRPQDRPQSVAEFLGALEGRIVPPAMLPRKRAVPLGASDSFAATVSEPRDAEGENPVAPSPAYEATVAVGRSSTSTTSAKNDAELADALQKLRRTRVRPTAQKASHRRPLRLAAFGVLSGLLIASAAVAWWGVYRGQPSGATATVRVEPTTQSTTEGMAQILERTGGLAPPNPARGAAPVRQGERMAHTAALPGKASPPMSDASTSMAMRPGDRAEPLARTPAPFSVARPNYRNNPADGDGVAPQIVLDPAQSRAPMNQAVDHEADRSAETPSQKLSPLWPTVPTQSKDDKAPQAVKSAPRVSQRVPQSPSEVCDSLSFFKRLICQKNECGTERFFSHPECVRMREQEEAERQRRLLSGNR